MNTIAETGSRPEIRKYARPRAMLGEFSAQKAPKSSGKRVLVGESTKAGQSGRTEAPGLCGAGEACAYADLPLIQQPFWDVEIVTVPFAPGAQLSRGGIGLWHQV